MGYGDDLLKTVHTPRRIDQENWEDWYVHRSTRHRNYWNYDFKAQPGKLVVPTAYQAWASGHTEFSSFVMIEPNVKRAHSADNKQWPFDRYQEVVDQLPCQFVQCLSRNTERRLVGVKLIQTPSFLHAVAVLQKSVGYLGSEGGLHHAAAALGQRAVVIWGCYSPPEVLGYDFHENLCQPDPEGSGWRKSHPLCRAAMLRTTVKEVADACIRSFDLS